jgi:hypothetical protein
MTATWVLIMVLANGHGMTTTQAYFASQDMCQSARKSIETDVGKARWTRIITSNCYPNTFGKGTP